MTSKIQQFNFLIDELKASSFYKKHSYLIIFSYLNANQRTEKNKSAWKNNL